MFKLVSMTGVSDKCGKNSTLHKEPMNNYHTVSVCGLSGKKKTQVHLLVFAWLLWLCSHDIPWPLGISDEADCPHASHMSACQIELSHGTATDPDKITKQTWVMHVSYLVWGLGFTQTYTSGFLLLDPEDIRKLPVGAIWNFAKGTGLL